MLALPSETPEVDNLLIGIIQVRRSHVSPHKRIHAPALPSKDVRHQEVHQGPQLHQAVLQRGSSEKEASLRVERQERLPPLALEVFDVLGLVQDKMVPLRHDEARQSEKGNHQGGPMLSENRQSKT